MHRNGIDAAIDIVRERRATPRSICHLILTAGSGFCAGTGTPVVVLQAGRGLNSSGLEPLNLIGMDIVEVSPAYDHAEITAIAAAMCFDWLAVMAMKRGATLKLSRQGITAGLNH